MHVSGIGQVQGVHDVDECLPCDAPAQTGISGHFLPDGRDGVAVIIMAGEYQGIRRQGKQLVMNAVIQGARVTLLKIGASTAANQEGIPREYPVSDPQADAVRGVPGRMEYPYFQVADLEQDAIGNQQIGATRPRIAVEYALAAQSFPQQSRTRDVVRVDMGLDGEDQIQPVPGQDFDHRVHLAGDGVDQNRAACSCAAQQIGQRMGVGLNDLLSTESGYDEEDYQKGGC